MLKIKHLRHPLRTAAVAKQLLSSHLNVRKFADLGERRYSGDPRYVLQNVEAGFASHLVDQDDDTELLERICTAYVKTIERQDFALAAYRATPWWERVRQGSLGPVTHALATQDIHSLRRMYRNFFRDRCSAGLSGMPVDMAKAHLEGRMDNLHRRYFLADALYRLDYWEARNRGRFELKDLKGPELGNPFGLAIDDVLVRTGSEYHHYCARRIIDALNTKDATVVEIGGGFGGTAYYLIRDRPDVTYIDLDLPESLALTSYYLIKALPRLKVFLYGEGQLTKEAISQFEVILLPAFELEKIPSTSAGLVFSSHAVSDLPGQVMTEYLDQISRITRGSYLNVGSYLASQLMRGLVSKSYPSMVLVEGQRSEWNAHRMARVREEELHYRVGI